MPELRDRAAALAGELIQLKREAALTADLELNQQLKEVRRILKPLRGGQPFSEEAYDRLKERIADELYGAADSEERAVTERKASLTASVRRTVEAELADKRAEQEAEAAATAAALEDREQAVAERERQACPSYRARFAAAGALLVLSADFVSRTVA